jgi:hypothetical protein
MAAGEFRREAEMKTFLAAGDVLINPSLLAYAAVDTDTEGPQLRLGFAGQAGSAHCEVKLTGLEARSVLRWLRTNAEFLDQGANPFRRERAVSPIVAVEPGESSCRPHRVAVALDATV